MKSSNNFNVIHAFFSKWIENLENSLKAKNDLRWSFRLQIVDQLRTLIFRFVGNFYKRIYEKRGDSLNSRIIFYFFLKHVFCFVMCNCVLRNVRDPVSMKSIAALSWCIFGCFWSPTPNTYWLLGRRQNTNRISTRL